MPAHTTATQFVLSVNCQYKQSNIKVNLLVSGVYFQESVQNLGSQGIGWHLRFEGEETLVNSPSTRKPLFEKLVSLIADS